MGYSYVILDQDERPDQLWRAKIGRAGDPRKRLSQMQTGSAGRLGLLCVFEGVEWEALLHRQYSSYRIAGEWFALEGHQVMTLADLAAARDEEFVDYDLTCVVGLSLHRDNNHSHAYYAAFSEGEGYAAAMLSESYGVAS
jgi:hypothetical protein